MLDVRESTEVKGGKPSAKPRGCHLKSVRKTSEGRSRGARINCVLSRKGVNPLDEIEWERRSASITDDKGGVIFQQNDVEVPKSWSMLATNVVASKYFYGAIGKDERE